LDVDRKIREGHHSRHVEKNGKGGIKREKSATQTERGTSPIKKVRGGDRGTGLEEI